MQQTCTPRVWIGCLAAYNNGQLHGKWVDVSDIDTLQDDIKTVLASSPQPNAEEWAFMDSEYLGEIGENPDLEELCLKAEYINEHGDIGLEVLKYCDNDLNRAIAVMDSSYGAYDSELDYTYYYVEEMFSDVLKAMGSLDCYFDYEAYHRDLFKHGEYFSIYKDGQYHIFSED